MSMSGGDKDMDVRAALILPYRIAYACGDGSGI